LEKLKRVFIIDDNSITQFLSAKAVGFTKCAEEVTCFDNAEQALNFLMDETKDISDLPELIMLDLEMPVMDGWEFLEQYNLLHPAIKQHTKVCVLASTLNPNQKEFLRKNPLVFEYIVKPLIPDKFSSLVNRIEAAIKIT
jgi:CheY-like chemotaxis protein